MPGYTGNDILDEQSGKKNILSLSETMSFLADNNGF